MLGNTPKQPSKFKTKFWVEINDGSYGECNTGSPIKFKTSLIRSRLCYYNDTYIRVKTTISVPSTGIAAALNNRNKKLISTNCAPFTDCISEINDKEIDHAKIIDVVMPVYNLIEHSGNYLKTSGSSWQYYRDEPFKNDDGDIIDVPDDPDSALSKYKQDITGQAGNNGTKDVQIMVPSKYLSNFSTLAMPFINCQINIF